MLVRMLRAFLLCLLMTAASASAAPWVLTDATKIELLVPWRGLTVRLAFPRYGGIIDFDETAPETAAARIEVASGAVTTGLPLADRVARSEDFLAADRYPIIRFDLDRLVQTSQSTADIYGRITFRGVTRAILFKATVRRYDPGSAAFDLEGAIDRAAFGANGAPGDVPAILPVRIRLDMVAR